MYITVLWKPWKTSRMLLEHSNEIKWQFCQLQTLQNHNSDRITDLRVVRVLKIAVWTLDSPSGFCHYCTQSYSSLPLCCDILKCAFSNARQELWPSICLLNYPMYCWHWWQSVVKKTPDHLWIPTFVSNWFSLSSMAHGNFFYYSSPNLFIAAWCRLLRRKNLWYTGWKKPIYTSRAGLQFVRNWYRDFCGLDKNSNTIFKRLVMIVIIPEEWTAVVQKGI